MNYRSSPWARRVPIQLVEQPWLTYWSASSCFAALVNCPTKLTCHSQVIITRLQRLTPRPNLSNRSITPRKPHHPVFRPTNRTRQRPTQKRSTPRPHSCLNYSRHSRTDTQTVQVDIHVYRNSEDGMVITPLMLLSRLLMDRGISGSR